MAWTKCRLAWGWRSDSRLASHSLATLHRCHGKFYHTMSYQRSRSVALQRVLDQTACPFRWDSSRLIALLFFCASFLIFNSNLRTIGAVDTYAARYLPLSIWKNGSLVLDPIAQHVAQGASLPQQAGQKDDVWWILKTKQGSLVSMYPPITPVLVAPLYAPAVMYLNATDWSLQRVERVGRIMEKLSASFVASISVACMFLLLRRQCDVATSAGLASLFAFGTSTWVISSQALWMHGVAQLLVIALLWLAVTPLQTPWRGFIGGLLCALLACNRQPDAILAMGFALHALARDRRNFGFFIAGAVLPVAATLVYNVQVVGNVVGGYGLAMEGKQLDLSVPGTIDGVLGLLISPVHGLLLFSPFLVFAPLGFMLQAKQPSNRLLSLLLAATTVCQLFFYGAVNWTSGVSWGPRFMTDMLPILIWVLPVVIQRLSVIGRRAFVALGLFAVASSAVGAFGYNGSVHAEYLSVHPASNWKEHKTSSAQAAWMVAHSPWKNQPTLFNDLFPGLYGSIDRLSISPEGVATVEGWSLFGSRQPFDVHLLIDGARVPGGAGHFEYREDVAKFMGNSTAGAWKISFPASLLTSDRPVFSALVRSHLYAMPWALQAFELPKPAVAPSALKASMDASWQGSIDVVRVYPNRGVEVVGWTARGRQAPENLELWLDGERVAVIDSFFRRPDVEQALGWSAPSGWRVRIPARRLPGGEHKISVVLPAQNSALAPQQLISRIFSVTAPADAQQWSHNMPMEELARLAARTLEHQQDSDGYWLTDYTTDVRFHQPGVELNVFSTAAIVDLLSPVGERLKLSDTLNRARGFLSLQIEESGLVRYHGRPDLPSHGVMGCKITPDADDTALVWRLAPVSDGKLQTRARAALEAFKTPEGLYRTWLATPDHYECIDPGQDPNPADIGIQIHVLMWLYQIDPMAARELCIMLQSRSEDPSLWVYYKRAPAAVVWRLPALQAMGCPLKLPPSLLAVEDTDQQLWLRVIEQIQVTEAGGDRRQLKTNEDLLRKLADGGFLRVWQSPLLYFHNDLTATVRRYYWSPELGLALWLRLFVATEQARQVAVVQR